MPGSFRNRPPEPNRPAVHRRAAAAFGWSVCLSLLGLAALVGAQGGFGAARGLLSRLKWAVPEASCHVETTSPSTVGCPVRQRRLLRDTRPGGWNQPFSANLDEHCRCVVAPTSAGGRSSLRGLIPATAWVVFFSLEPRRPVRSNPVYARGRPFSQASPRAPPEFSSVSFEIL